MACGWEKMGAIITGMLVVSKPSVSLHNQFYFTSEVCSNQNIRFQLESEELCLKVY